MADALAQQLENLTKAGRDEHGTRTRRYDHSYNVYRGISKHTGETWQSKLRVKYGMQVIDTALVNIVSGKPRVIVRPRTPHDIESAKAMQALLDYYITEDHLVEKQPAFVQQGLIYGVTVAKNHWIYKECTRTIREPSDMVDGKLVPHQYKYVDKDGPCFEPWDVYHAWWDPDGRDVDSCRYVVLRSYVTVDELKALQANEDAGTGVYRNLDRLFSKGASGVVLGSDKAVSYLEDGTSQQDRNSSQKNKDKIELQEIWRETPDGLWLTVIGNRTTVIRDEQSPYWHGKKPIVIAQPRPDLFEMAGIPETELIDDIQQGLWTLSGMTFDNMHLTVMRGITYREGGVTDPNALELRPRFKWPVADHDDVQPFNVQPLPPEVMQVRESLLADSQLVTGINPYISGSNLNTVDQNTATGVTALQEVASRLLRFKAGQIADKGFQRTYEQWSEMIMQLQTRDVPVEILGEGGVSEWKTYTPQDVVGSYHVTLEGSEESLSRQQERGEAIALLNAFAPLAATGMINFKPLLERVASAYNFPNAEALLAAPPAPAAPTQPQLPAAPQNPQANGQLPGGQALDPRILSAITNQ